MVRRQRELHAGGARVVLGVETQSASARDALAQNNEKATVKQGVKIPIQTTINNTISVANTVVIHGRVR